jgi:hypothetical protein
MDFAEDAVDDSRPAQEPAQAGDGDDDDAAWELPGKPDGAVVEDYYPAVVDETTWHQAQASPARRRDKPGRVGETVATLFSGLICDARTGDRMSIAWQTRGRTAKGGTRRRVLVNSRSLEGAVPAVSFPHEVFESAVLSLLREINPADVLGKEPRRESVVVAADLAVKEHRVRLIEAELVGDDRDIPLMVRALRGLSTECDSVRKRLAELRQLESNPRSLTWTETLSLIDVATDFAPQSRTPASASTRSVPIAPVAWIRCAVSRRSSGRLTSATSRSTDFLPPCRRAVRRFDSAAEGSSLRGRPWLGPRAGKD